MNGAPRNLALRLVPKPEGAIDADLIAFQVMEFIDQQYPTFWDCHPKTARVDVRNRIVRAVRVAEAARGGAAA